MMELSTVKKNKISLTDYNYRRDIDNRLLMAEFKAVDLAVLEEILYSPLRVQTRKIAKNIDKAESEILLRTRSGKWLGGFAAFRYMAFRLPWFTLLAPFLYLPVIAQLGDVIYKVIAKNRYLILGGTCTHKVCQAVSK